MSDSNVVRQDLRRSPVVARSPDRATQHDRTSPLPPAHHIIAVSATSTACTPSDITMPPKSRSPHPSPLPKGARAAAEIRVAHQALSTRVVVEIVQLLFTPPPAPS